MPSLRARALRKNPTDAERLLWRHLRMRQLGGHRFRRQHPLGSYIVAFFCHEKRLVVEVDGGQHATASARDQERDRWMSSRGYRVLRFWNNQVFSEIEGVKQVILDTLES